MTAYFLDTYAMFEIIKGNPDFESYACSDRLITTRMNLLELYYGLLKKEGQTVADFYYRWFSTELVEAGDEEIKQAAYFRWKARGLALSYIDCLGYVTAMRFDVPFVTGDAAFQGFPNVEFVR
ncbi:MAG TPA: PIN domain-containing protein [Candidatus Norongarragalinales archaeon]|nr:PIN domain-containing protein [Candidatus Norongarragalinales archaeon]